MTLYFSHLIIKEEGGQIVMGVNTGEFHFQDAPLYFNLPPKKNGSEFLLCKNVELLELFSVDFDLWALSLMAF